LTKNTGDLYTHENDYKTIATTTLMQLIKRGDKNADLCQPLPIISIATPPFALIHSRGRRLGPFYPQS
jgi:hypothetical protein